MRHYNFVLSLTHTTSIVNRIGAYHIFVWPVLAPSLLTLTLTCVWLLSSVLANSNEVSLWYFVTQ